MGLHRILDAPIMESFYEAISHGRVFESDENEDVTVYEPIIMESILNYRDFYIGLLSEDASDLKRHDPPPYDEADEFYREHILKVGDILNKYILSSWISK